ncbi:hypothetical protein NG796_07845 [Laspinema sp. A4]|uniref:hypothetical protein n=1 Tax=Laspinema sp. D2d TaxID=2953686 RepID=UPI0021BAB512|nr:hypothetical protein [Laspinema sp. D2d]MCT7983203.1 hypothetical protein [Laspinema sp. D2d]
MGFRRSRHNLLVSRRNESRLLYRSWHPDEGDRPGIKITLQLQRANFFLKYAPPLDFHDIILDNQSGAYYKILFTTLII